MTTLSRSLSTEIVSLVDGHWEERQVPLLLSQLGATLSTEAKAELRSLHQPLRGYVSYALAGAIRLVNMAQHGEGVVPAHAAAEYSDAELLHRFQVQKMKEVAATSPRFFSSVWAAFTNRIAAGRKRYLEIQDNSAYYYDKEEHEEIPPDWIEILPNDLPYFNEETGRPHPADVVNAISAWAGRNHLDEKRLHRPEQSMATLSSSPKWMFHEDKRPRETVSALVNFLESLDAPELQRIAIPGDVLLAMLKKSRY